MYRRGKLWEKRPHFFRGGRPPPQTLFFKQRNHIHMVARSHFTLILSLKSNEDLLWQFFSALPPTHVWHDNNSNIT